MTGPGLGSTARWDEFTILAARLLDMPTAGVTMLAASADDAGTVDASGPSSATGPDEFDHALMLAPGHILLIDDASLHRDLARAPLVATEPFIRAYAAAALRDAAGGVVGKIFVRGPTPRTFDQADIDALATLATGIQAILHAQERSVELWKASQYDSLTGLLNRAPFKLRLLQAMTGVDPSRPSALVVLDIDNFKIINDCFGHAAGDAVLVETARRLLRSMGESDCAARLSGDEFAVLLGSRPDTGDACAPLRSILATFDDPFLALGESLSVRVSMGAYLLPGDDTEIAEVMHRADIALYDAKRQGGSRYAFFDPDFESAALRRGAIGSELASAASAGQLHLEWQPMVSPDGGTLRGYEALLRWNRPGHGPVSPAEFVPVAEQTGTIVAIDSWVLARACEQAAASPGQFLISVNVWPGWFGRKTLAETIRRALQGSGLPPSRLEIEVTERALIADDASALDEILAIKALGVRVALDDFGIGFSSMRSLSAFPFDSLKLDAAFVQELCVNPRSRRIALRTLQLGHDLNMEVCAEGVENETQRSVLLQDGYDWLQGYLIGKPAGLPDRLPC